MELTLNTSDFGGRSYFPVHGIKLIPLHKSLSTVKISIHKRIAHLSDIRKTRKSREFFNYINKPGQRGFTSCSINT